MKYVAKALFLLISSSLWVSCAQHTTYEKFPELINEDTGLREFRFRGADCIDTPYDHIDSNCDHRQEIITVKTPAGSADRVLIRELTPDLKEKSKTIVSPTVQYDERQGKIYVSAIMRINEDASQDFTEILYTFEGDLKGFRDKYKTDKNLKYIPLSKKDGGAERLNGMVYCADRPGCHEIALVFSYLNPDENGKKIIDSKTFTIDSRESNKVPTDTIPGQAFPKTLELLITKVEFPEEYEVDDIADPENSAIFSNVKAPVLPQDPTGFLCEGLTEDVKSDQCPDYIFDSTKPNPLHSNPVDESEAPVSVFNIDQEQLDTPNAILEQEDQEQHLDTATEHETPGINPTEQDSQAEEVKDSQQAIKRPVTRPDGWVPHTSSPDANAESNADADANALALQEASKEEAVATTAEDSNQVVLPETAPRPVPRPDHITELAKNTPPQVHTDTEEVELPMTAPRPRPRPEGLGTDSAAASVTGAPTGRDRLLSVDGRFVYDLRKCSTQLSQLQSGVFNQAKGIYHNGTLTQAKQFQGVFELNRPNAGRKDRHYASDLTILTVEYAACVLEQKYSNVKIDVHDFSFLRGGQLSRHSSHQNGLDVDVSYPHIAGRTQGFDSFATNLNDERVELALDYAKILYSTERVHIIFTDRRIKNRFCTFMKSKNSLTKEYKDFINNNFRHVNGHHNHYHLRMKCNSQNEFCRPQGTIITEKTCS